MRLSEEASGIYNYSQKVEELGSAHKLGDSPAFVPWTPSLDFSPSALLLDPSLLFLTSALADVHIDFTDQGDVDMLLSLRSQGAF